MFVEKRMVGRFFFCPHFFKMHFNDEFLADFERHLDLQPPLDYDPGYISLNYPGNTEN